MKRIKLNWLFLFFHYIVSILLLTFGALSILKSLVSTFEEGHLWEKDNLLHGGIVMIFIGILTLRREMRALEFSRIDLNGASRIIAHKYFLEILQENNWKVDIDNETEIRAVGFTSDNKSKLFASPKRLTIMFDKQNVFMNCIVEPPKSNQITFGRNKSIVKKLTTAFLEKFE